MKRITLVLATLVLVTSSSAQEAAPKPAEQAGGRSANAILADLKASEVPAFDAAKRNDREAILEFVKKRTEVLARRAELIKELLHADPANDRLPGLVGERWMTLAGQTPGRPNPEMDREIEEVLSGSRYAKLKSEALFMKAMFGVRARDVDLAAKLKVVEGFTDHAPKDPRGAQLLLMAAQYGSAKEQAEVYRKIVANYPDTRFAATAQGSLKRLESVGKPFELEFTDAIKGTTVAMKDLRGKVVVIDFWATWCGPCVAEMPKMKDLYAKYRDKGVEFIGVSLDQTESQGGLEKLKDFVAKNEIAWLQYYQGKGWESDFSRSWGVNSIPCVFVVDRKGNLYSVEARGKLDTLIPELLEQKESKSE